MRIIGGSHRGRHLHPPKGLLVRPTTDLAKESLFNILNNRIDFEDLRVLDLFAGTGNISLEFASRGAAQVVAVEMNHRCTEFISKASKDLGFENVYIVKANVFHYLRSVKRKFDLIFADPPYEMKEISTLPSLIYDHGLLANEGWLILEHDSSVNFAEHEAFREERHYGKVHFSFFQMQD